MCIKIENDVSPKPAETTKTEDRPKDLMLHTILLQNNALKEVPDVLGQIPSLKVIQLHGNPCAPAYENFKNFMVQNTKPPNASEHSEEPETKSTKIIAKSHSPFFCQEKLLLSVQFHPLLIFSVLGLKTKTFNSEVSTQ